MATVTKEVVIDAAPEDVWDALRDWGAIHTRLAPGFVQDARLDGPDRIITMFNGVDVRERLVAIDEDGRRLAWSIVEGPYAHHNASAVVLPEGAERSRFIWTADFLPDEVSSRTEQFMDRGINTIKDTLDASL